MKKLSPVIIGKLNELARQLKSTKDVQATARLTETKAKGTVRDLATEYEFPHAASKSVYFNADNGGCIRVTRSDTETVDFGGLRELVGEATFLRFCKPSGWEVDKDAFKFLVEAGLIGPKVLDNCTTKNDPTYSVAYLEKAYVPEEDETARRADKAS